VSDDYFLLFVVFGFVGVAFFVVAVAAAVVIGDIVLATTLGFDEFLLFGSGLFLFGRGRSFRVRRRRRRTKRSHLVKFLILAIVYSFFDECST